MHFIRITNIKLLFGICLFVSSAQAAVELEQALDFGTIVIIDNSAVGTISVTPSGKIDFSRHFRVLTLGHAAEFTLSQYPSYKMLSIGAAVMQAQTQVASGLGTQQFTLVSVKTDTSVVTDSNGMASVFIGGTLQSSGDPRGHYIDTEYQARLLMTIDY